MVQLGRIVFAIWEGVLFCYVIRATLALLHCCIYGARGDTQWMGSEAI